MAASKYKLWGWGAPVGRGITGSVYVGMAAVAKKASPAEPHIVGNELTCSMIARTLLLPCPPGALVSKDSDIYYCSLDFNHAGQALPPVDPATVVSTHPELAWGIIIFDVLVMNGDRHEANLSHDATSNDVTIFDHSHAFMRSKSDIDALLSQADGQLGIGGHCLASHINTWNGFNSWIARVKSLPDWFLEGAIEEGCAVGIPQGKQKQIYDFMRNRRDSIDTILTNNRPSFLPNAPTTGP